MSKTEIPIQKKHASGSWRVVRSMAVPANVTTAHPHEISTHQSGTRRIQKVEEESILLKAPKSPSYFETADSAFSKP